MTTPESLWISNVPFQNRVPQNGTFLFQLRAEVGIINTNNTNINQITIVPVLNQSNTLSSTALLYAQEWWTFRCQWEISPLPASSTIQNSQGTTYASGVLDTLEQDRLQTLIVALGFSPSFFRIEMFQSLQNPFDSLLVAFQPNRTTPLGLLYLFRLPM